MAFQWHFIKYCVISNWSCSPRSFRKVFAKGDFVAFRNKWIYKEVFLLMSSKPLCKFLFHKSYTNLVTLENLCICQISFRIANRLGLLFFLGNAWNIPPPQTHNHRVITEAFFSVEIQAKKHNRRRSVSINYM